MLSKTLQRRCGAAWHYGIVPFHLGGHKPVAVKPAAFGLKLRLEVAGGGAVAILLSRLRPSYGVLSEAVVGRILAPGLTVEALEKQAAKRLKRGSKVGISVMGASGGASHPI